LWTNTWTVNAKIGLSVRRVSMSGNRVCSSAMLIRPIDGRNLAPARQLPEETP
jgi:hypothetical protein